MRSSLCHTLKPSNIWTVTLIFRRIIMNKRRSVLETVRLSTDKGKQMRQIANKIFEYYVIYDLDNKTNHSKVFEMLYLCEKIYTYDQVAEATNLSLPTLNRYIKRYSSLAQLLLEKERL